MGRVAKIRMFRRKVRGTLPKDWTRIVATFTGRAARRLPPSTLGWQGGVMSVYAPKPSTTPEEHARVAKAAARRARVGERRQRDARCGDWRSW